VNQNVVVRLPPVLLAAVVLHTAVFPHLRLFGVAADVLLLLPIAAGIAAGPERGAFVGFLAGLLADCFLQTPFGLSALTACLVGWCVGAFQTGMLQAAAWVPMVTAFVATAVGIVAFALVGAMLGEDQLVSTRLFTIVAVASALNAVLGPAAVKVMRWAVAGPTPNLMARTR
jgi:rod shape-determining protein MreD